MPGAGHLGFQGRVRTGADSTAAQRRGSPAPAVLSPASSLSGACASVRNVHSSILHVAEGVAGAPSHGAAVVIRSIPLRVVVGMFSPPWSKAMCPPLPWRVVSAAVRGAVIDEPPPRRNVLSSSLETARAAHHGTARRCTSRS